MLNFALRYSMISAMIAGPVHNAQTSPKPQPIGLTKPAQSRRTAPFKSGPQQQASLVPQRVSATQVVVPPAVVPQFQNQLYDIPLSSATTQQVSQSDATVSASKDLSATSANKKSGGCETSCSVQ